MFISAGKAAEEFASIGIVECMAFSSDGRILGVSTADGLLTIYDWHTGRALNVLRCPAAKFPCSRVGRLYCKYPVGQSPTSQGRSISCYKQYLTSYGRSMI